MIRHANDRYATISPARPPSTVALMQHQASRALLWIRPDGWQGRARRNAWSAMVADRQRRLERGPVERDPRIATPTVSRTVQAH